MRLSADIPDLVAFADLAEVKSRCALRLRIGPARDHRDLTYGELAEVVRRRAGALHSCGCRRGERVALLLPHTECLATTFLGALYLGLVPSIVAWPTVKMDRGKYQRNLRAVLASLQARWLVTEGPMAEALGQELGDTQVLAPSALAAEAVPVPSDPQREGVAFIQFSGGTTGTQKSVPISYDLLARQLDAYARALALRDTDHVISWLPLYHDMGLVACLLLPFAFRLPLTLHAPMEWVMDPTAFLREIGRAKATHCWLPNFAYAFMASRVRNGSEPLVLETLRGVINCSEPVRAASMDVFAERFASNGLRAAALHTCYAMAEATFAVTQSTDVDPPLRLQVCREAFGAGRLKEVAQNGRVLVSCGVPVAGFDVRVASAAGGALPEGEIGEIWLRSGSVMVGYLDTPAQSAAFTDGWYRTGDMGAMVRGHLFVTGRKKDLIIVGGVNIYPEDLENAVGALPGVHAGRVVALGFEDAVAGTERLVLVAEVDNANTLSRQAEIELGIRESVATVCGIAPYRVFVVPPKWIVKSTAGKISRVETRARIVAAGGLDDFDSARVRPEAAT